VTLEDFLKALQAKILELKHRGQAKVEEIKYESHTDESPLERPDWTEPETEEKP
jgi:hypothetical protein